MTNEATLDRTGTGCQVHHYEVAAKPRIRKGTGWAWAPMDKADALRKRPVVVTRISFPWITDTALVRA